MENAVDALKMAASILIFIIAITVSFSLFGTAKRTADSIITMRDRQAYLEAAELDTVLYTSSSAIQSGETEGSIESSVKGFTTNGDRIVEVSDVVSTIYRYNKEKYGVTIVDNSGNVIIRYDSGTENIMRRYNNIESGLDEYKERLEANTQNNYANPKFRGNVLETIYQIDIIGGSNRIKCGAPWYGNDGEIQKRIGADLNGETYTYNGQIYNKARKNILTELKNASRIVEVTNEIDQSQYLQHNGQGTNLLQQYEMPMVEIIYILY